MPSFRLISPVAAIFLCVPPVFAQAPAPATPAAAPAYATNPSFVATLKDAQTLEKKHSPFALDSYKKANRLADGKCVECLDGMYHMQIAMEKYKDAVATTDLLLALAANPLDRSMAATFRGEALVAQAGSKPKPAQLQAAHAAFQQALAEAPRNLSALYSDGKVLAQMGDMEHARAEFQQCVQCARPNDPVRIRAQHFAENPELSLHKMAPAFEVTALDGTRFNLDAMTGHVVLIDFWATWCGPCNEELPSVKHIAKVFEGQPLTIISVSWDSNEEAWKSFIKKNDMTWMQYRDADHKLSNLFGVEAIPHYFTIDSDGVLTQEMIGSGHDVEGKLGKLLAKARESQPAKPANAQPALLPRQSGNE